MDPSSGTTSGAAKNAQPPPPLPPEEDHQAPVSSVTQTAEELQLFMTQQLVARMKDLERDRAQLNAKLDKFNKKEEQWNQWRVDQADINRLLMAELQRLSGENEGIADADPSVSVVEFMKEKLAKVGKKLEEAEKDKEEDERVFKELTDEIDSLKEQLNEIKIDRKQELELKDARIRELEAEILELKIQKSTEEEKKKTLDQIRRILDENEDRDKEEPQPAEPQPCLPKKQDKKVEDDGTKPVEVDKNTDMTVALLSNAAGFNMIASARKKTSGNEETVGAQDLSEIEKQLQVVPISQRNGSRPTLAQEFQLGMGPQIILRRCDYKEKTHESKKKVRFESSLESSQTETDDDHEVECNPKMKKQEVVIPSAGSAPKNGMETVPFRKRCGRPVKLNSLLFKCFWCTITYATFHRLRLHMKRSHQFCWLH